MEETTSFFLYLENEINFSKTLKALLKFVKKKNCMLTKDISSFCLNLVAALAKLAKLDNL